VQGKETQYLMKKAPLHETLALIRAANLPNRAFAALFFSVDPNGNTPQMHKHVCAGSFEMHYVRIPLPAVIRPLVHIHVALKPNA